MPNKHGQKSATQQAGFSSNAHGLLAPNLITDLVGVIDLKQGSAVHAVAGNRSAYQPLAFGQIDGDPRLLADHYWQLGLRRLYVADLDGIAEGQPQRNVLLDLLSHCDRFDELLLDVGTSEKSLAELAPALDHHHRIVLATESLASLDAFRGIAGEQIDAESLLLGIDYRQGVFMAAEGSEADWVSLARDLGIAGAVVLDVSSVGTADSRAARACCRRIRSIDPSVRIYGGGGIRSSDDVVQLRKDGCNRFLVATALHRQ